MLEKSAEHNLSRFLVKIAHLLEPSGCRTVGDLLASGVLPEDLTAAAKAVLRSLATLDYVALRDLAVAVEDPMPLLDDDSYFRKYEGKI